MFYKEWKYLAAHYILKVLKKQTGVAVLNDDKTKKPDVYQWVDIYKIKKISPFWTNKDVLYDAARMMFIAYKNPDNELDMLNNENDKFKSEFKLLDKGLIAYKDGKYFRMFLKSWKTIIAIMAAVITFILGVIIGLQQIGVLCKCQ